MKRLLCFILCLVLLPLFAQAQSLSLPEKLQFQLDAGSGFRGNYTLYVGNAQGDSKSKLNGELSYIKADAESSLIVFDSDAKALLELNDSDNGTMLFINNKAINLASQNSRLTNIFADFLSRYFNIPQTFKTIISVASFRPSFNSETKLLEKQKLDELDDIVNRAFQKYTSDLDLWLQNFMAASEKSKDEKGNDIMGMQYEVPMESIRDYLKYLVGDIANDYVLMEALHQYLPSDMQSLLPNKDNLEFINLVIDALPLNGNVKLAKSFTFKGEPLAIKLYLPMYDALSGEYSLEYIVDFDIDNSKQVEKLRLINNLQDISISFVQNNSEEQHNYKGEISIVDSENKSQSLAMVFDINSLNKFFVDADGKNNQQTKLYGTINNNDEHKDATIFTKVDNYSFELEQSYKSGVAKNTSTSMLLKASIENLSKKNKISLDFEGKTTAFWAIEKQDITDVNLLDLSLDTDWNTLIKEFENLLKSKLGDNQYVNDFIKNFSTVFEVKNPREVKKEEAEIEPIDIQTLQENVTAVEELPSQAPSETNTP